MYFRVSRLLIPCMESVMCLDLKTYYAQHAFCDCIQPHSNFKRSPPPHRQGCGHATPSVLHNVHKTQAGVKRVWSKMCAKLRYMIVAVVPKDSSCTLQSRVNGAYSRSSVGAQ